MVCTFPLDTIRMRLTTDCTLKVESQRLFNNFFDCLKKVLKTEGVRGLYRGFVFASVTHAPNQIINAALYTLIVSNNTSDENSILTGISNKFNPLAVAVTAGLLITHPLDTIR